jgi:hypothetical protein
VAAFASGRTYPPEGVVKFVKENVEAFCLDRRNGGHGSFNRDRSTRVMQDRGETFGDSAIEVESNLFAHATTLREQPAGVDSKALRIRG